RPVDRSPSALRSADGRRRRRSQPLSQGRAPVELGAVRSVTVSPHPFRRPTCAKSEQVHFLQPWFSPSGQALRNSLPPPPIRSTPYPTKCLSTRLMERRFLWRARKPPSPPHRRRR